jgi:uncharacterized membrane protein YfcA
MALTAYALAVVLGAAIVRGYAEFGFSLLAISALSLVFTPAEVIPIVFMLELAGSIHLLPQVWREIDWRSLRWLLPACVAATPLGVHLLATVPAAQMRMGLSAAVLASAILLARGFAFPRMPGTGATVAAGMVSGLLNGSFGSGVRRRSSSISRRPPAWPRLAHLSSPTSWGPTLWDSRSSPWSGW